jgi:hypothetical protein
MKNLFIFIFFALPFMTNAQTHELGVQIGLMNYRGELAPVINYQDTRQGWGFFYRANISKAVSLRLNGLYGSIAADDKKSTDKFALERNHQFRTNLWEISGVLEYNFLNFRNEGRKLRERQQNFTPYLSGGIGYMQFRPFFNTNPNYDTYSVIMPLGVGIKFAVGKYFNVGAEFVSRITFTKYLDDLGVITNKNQIVPNNPKYYTGNPNRNDAYFFTNITLSYVIPDKKKDCPVIVQ